MLPNKNILATVRNTYHCKNTSNASDHIKRSSILPFLTTSALIGILSWSTVEATTIVGVTGDDGDGDFQKKSFYLVDTDSGESIYKGTASVTPNQIAFNQETQTYYYMSHYGTDLYSFNINTASETYLGDLTSYGMPAGKIGSGGGEFYNGNYFYTPESDTAAIYSVTFTNGGLPLSTGTSFTPSNILSFSTSGTMLGDFGDIAVDDRTGYMYGSSVMRQNRKNYTALWYVDLTEAGNPMTIIKDDLENVYQLAFDENHNLWANLWENDGELLQIDIVNGNIIDTKTLKLNGDPTGGDFFDLASTGKLEGPVIIPEPSTGLLGLIGVMLILRRRKE